MAGESVVPHTRQTTRGGASLPLRAGRPPLAAGGPILAPGPSATTTLGMASEGSKPLLGACNPTVVQTIQCSRAPSTNALYANRWKLFVSWCQARHQEPTRCPIPVILDFLQSHLDDGLAPSTIKVYIATISARHNRVDGVTVGSNSLVSRFLKGAQRLRPPQRSPRASWDLPVFLQVLGKPPFEPLGRSELKWLSMKTAFLLAMASAKRVGELHALSISRECLHWSPDGPTLHSCQRPFPHHM